MKQFWEDVWYGLKRSFPRTWYFIRHGRVHPEVRESYGWPEYTIVGGAPGGGGGGGSSVNGDSVAVVGGSWTLSYRGQTRQYSPTNVLLRDSDQSVNWALQWANTESEN